MGMFDFIKDAGEKLFGFGRDDDDNADLSENLAAHVRDNGIDPGNLRFNVDTGDGTVTVAGSVPTQEEREKVVVIVGNIRGVSRVDDQIVVAPQGVFGDAPEATGEVSDEAAGEAAEAAAEEAAAEWESRTYTVQSGDTLWGISKQMYGEGSKYMKIFEANTPMLKDPDKIYPGQVLRIPKLED